MDVTAGRVPSVAETAQPWQWCSNHPPTDDKGPHGWVTCQERERRFRAMTLACGDDLSRYRSTADLARAVLDAAGGHDTAGHCSGCPRH